MMNRLLYLCFILTAFISCKKNVPDISGEWTLQPDPCAVHNDKGKSWVNHFQDYIVSLVKDGENTYTYTITCSCSIPQLIVSGVCEYDPNSENFVFDHFAEDTYAFGGDFKGTYSRRHKKISGDLNTSVWASSGPGINQGEYVDAHTTFTMTKN
jgi:hypothetical protein